MDFPHGITATRLRSTATLDVYSGETVARDWTDPVELDLGRGALDPGSSSEPTQDARSEVINSPRWIGTPADVKAGDRLVVLATTYDVDGDPLIYRSPFSTRQIMAVTLKSVTG